MPIFTLILKSPVLHRLPLDKPWIRVGTGDNTGAALRSPTGWHRPIRIVAWGADEVNDLLAPLFPTLGALMLWSTHPKMLSVDYVLPRDAFALVMNVSAQLEVTP
jgi:hypothetical protein